MRFHTDGTLRISPSSSPTPRRNLALEELVPLTRVLYEGDFLVCRLDTGASETAAFTMPQIAIEAGRRVMTLRDRPVYTKAITDEKDNYLFCNLGLDLLSQFPEYTIDFRSMSFRLGSD